MIAFNILLGLLPTFVLAGSRLVNGPAVTWAGHPHIHGCVTYPDTSNSSWEVAAFSLEAGILGGMQALDGLFIAANRDAARRIGFDAATFDGFHFYDLDRSVSEQHLRGTEGDRPLGR